MARRSTSSLYDNCQNLQIFIKNGFSETRNINLTVTDFNEYLLVKIRDNADFVFNYSAHIDMRRFEIMRGDQSLDIDFLEFKSNLVDMLRQVQTHEMFLKCEIDGNLGRLIFYGKSKIKSLIFLVIDVQITNQKEVFDEMNNSILELQSVNKNLNSNLQLYKTRLQERDLEIEKFVRINKELEKHFLKDLEKLNYIFFDKLQQCSSLLLNKILGMSQRVLKLIRDVEIVKTESLLKADSSTKLLHSMENLRLESVETSKVIEELKRENCSLKSAHLSNERVAHELSELLAGKDLVLEKLQSERNELERDVKQATKIIAQKTTANEELARDVVKANQALVNFNHLFDRKNTEIEELSNAIIVRDKMIQENTQRIRDVCLEFSEYKVAFNPDQKTKWSQELQAAYKRIEELEKSNRETAKLNELLTRKLAAGDFTRRNF